MPSISIPTAVLIAGGLGAAGAVASGALGSSAAKQAAQIQATAAEKASTQQLDIFNATRSDLAPFVGLGKGALPGMEGLLPGSTSPAGSLDAVRSLLGLTGPGGSIPEGGLSTAGIQKFLESTPGYQFTRDQGLRSVQSGFSAKGLASSGAALKGAAEYAAGLASQTYEQQLQNYLTNYQNQFTNQMDVVKTGANAASLSGQIGQKAGEIAGGFSTSGGAATAGGIIGGVNALTSGITGATTALGQTALLTAMNPGGIYGNNQLSATPQRSVPSTWTSLGGS